MSYKEAYGYAVARIRAMELRLLDASVFTRMLDAEDTASVLKVLGETSYAAALTSVSGEGGIDKVLETVLHDTYEEVNSFVPQKELVALLRLPYDFSNAKVMLKSVFSVRSGSGSARSSRSASPYGSRAATCSKPKGSSTGRCSRLCSKRPRSSPSRRYSRG